MHAEGNVHQVERSLKDLGDKVTESDRAPITAAVNKVKTAITGTDVQAIKSAVSELEQASQAMAQHLYKKGPEGGPAGAQTPPPGPGGDGKGGDDVIDAEFEVKK